MQYLEHALFGVALLIFLGVVLVVGLAVVASLVRKSRPKVPVVYPIPPAERGTGQHVSLLDLVDDHVAAEDRRRRRQKVSDKLYDWTQADAPPKA